ncbi:hypothetical protein [Puia sp.]|jgi:hypothetical protein|uniref:hypothetical protein n=1 Tax=Puia sp. TaxID=2045100 RepID=UPI002F415AC4
MRSFCISGLIFCGLLLSAAQTSAQTLFAYTENNNIILRWTAANERFVDRYVVEHSTDSVYFTSLHEVVSKGPFTDDTENSYQDADTYPSASANFYRVRTVLRDGGSFYSAVVRADVNTMDMPVLKPTVIHMGGTLRLDNYRSNQLLTVNIFNANGTLLGSYMVNGTSFNINTDRLAKGILFYRISDATHPLIDAGKLMVL